ncbi:MAG: ATP-binding protein [Sphingobacteriales bacterium]
MEIIENEQELVKKIKSSNIDAPVGAKLETDERVIARITDGIYRQPGSALRELISNAYDADATKVIIKTDAPRFSRISIEDNGHGMSPETLAYMLKHIGGSSKRNSKGQELGVTSDNAFISPNGRRLIGKIGIGIFSVAQLTHSFQIITKKRGDDYRTVATIVLKQYSDEPEKAKPDKFESGLVTIWQEPASDVETQGTTIILTNIRVQAKETLQSKEQWISYEDSLVNPEKGEIVLPPKYHIGRTQRVNADKLETGLIAEKSVPWRTDDLPKVAFEKLVDAVWQEAFLGNQNPRLEQIFDYYLQMVWTLSLATPLPYIQSNLFDLPMSHWAHMYLTSNEPKGAAKGLPESDNQTLRKLLNLSEGKNPEQFDVYLDNLQLSHPIKYQGLPTGGHRLKKPVILVGQCKQPFTNIKKEFSTGELAFEAYLFWNPIIAPAEHRGVLIRVNGASGTLFDPTFLKYQVSEQVRLRQIVCEIFVHQGFDSALNIDRESFNSAHPHAVYLTRWLHGALRQLATVQKRLASEVRTEAREEQQTQFTAEIQNIAINTWQREVKDDYSFPPSVAITSEKNAEVEQSGDIVVKRPAARKGTKKAASKDEQMSVERFKAITQIMAAFRVFDKLSQQEQERLLNAIYDVLEVNK